MLCNISNKMVKRSTDYKQVYLVDSLYFRNCNQQNALSSNQHITLSTPKSNQFFNNHYHNPSSTSKECDCNNLQKQVNPSFLNPREYIKSNTSLHLNNPKQEYDFKNVGVMEFMILLIQIIIMF